MRRRDLLIFLAATGLRVAFVWGQSRFAWFDIQFFAADSQLYTDLTESLVRGQGFTVHGRPTAFVTPGYPLFLAALYSVNLTSPLSVGLVQSVLGGAMCVLLARIAGKVWGEGAALWAGLLGAVYPHFIFWTGYLLTETLFVFFVVASLLALVWLPVRPSVFRAAGCGLLLGLAALVRPVILGCALIVPFWLVWAVRTSLPRRLLLAAVAVCAVAIPLAPWAFRNAVVLAAPVFTSTESGGIFYQGNSPGATGGSRGYVDALDYTPLAVPPGLSEVEANRYHWRRALEFLAGHPGAIPRLFVQKLVNMWRPTYTGASWRNVVILGGSYLFLMVFGLIGIVRGLRDRLRSPSIFVLLLFIVTFVVQHGLVTGMIRFRLPVEAAIVVFAALGLDACVSYTRGLFRQRYLSSAPTSLS